MPISTAPYKREYKHTKSRGKEKTVKCDACGRLVPRYKTFTTTRKMRLGPAVMKQIDKRMVHLLQKKKRLCPSCARFRGVSKPGKSTRKKYGGGNPSRRSKRN